MKVQKKSLFLKILGYVPVRGVEPLASGCRPDALIPLSETGKSINMSMNFFKTKNPN